MLIETNAGVGDRWRFTGREYDSATGLMYYRARYYSPARGVFLSEDPLGFGGGDANLYRYASNRPQMLVDPFGLTVTISYQGLVSAAHRAGSALAGGTLGYACGYIEAWYNGDQNPARTAWREAVTGAVLGAAAGPVVGQLPAQMQLFAGIALAVQAVASGEDFVIRGLRGTCIIAEFGIGGGLRGLPDLLRDTRPPVPSKTGPEPSTASSQVTRVA